MRELYEFQILRYYPKIESDFFFNVGIKIGGKIIQIRDKELFKLSNLIDIKKVRANLKNHGYQHHMRYSEVKRFRSSKSEEEVIEIIYKDYVVI